LASQCSREQLSLRTCAAECKIVNTAKADDNSAGPGSLYQIQGMQFHRGHITGHHGQ